MRGENNSMVDRRIIVKLLVTYFEKGSSKEVLSLMARMLVGAPVEGQEQNLMAVHDDMAQAL